MDLMISLFGCGHIRRDWSDRTLKYEVRKLDDLLTKIIPHFYKYPLKSAKQKDFLQFEEICERVQKLEHRRTKTLRTIMRDAYTMNGSGKRKRTLETLLSSLEMKI